MQPALSGPRVLILGGGGNVFAEARAALAMFEPDAVCVVNDMIARWPEPIDYICTLHPEKLGGWLKNRLANGYQTLPQIWAHKRAKVAIGIDGFEVHKLTSDWAGSSGLFATKAMLEERAARIVLAGVPIEMNANHVVRQRPWTAANVFKTAWQKRLPLLKDKVRSMSGWTQELLGAPDEQWLNGH